MKVVVNCRFLTQPMTGVQQYALKLSLYLKQVLQDKVVFVSPKGIEHSNLADQLGVVEIGNTRGFFWEQVELPFWLKKESSPLLINFGNVAPQYYANQIVTIHDLSTIEHPEWFNNKFARAYKFMIPQVVKNAKHVIAVSNFTKGRIHGLLGVNNDRITVIYNSIDPVQNSFVFAQPQPYFLSVGSFSGRKNFATLIKAFQLANLPGFELKIRGDLDAIFKGADELEELVKNDARIHFVEPLNYTAYMEMIKNATALINTSVYEGFGMPNLEALSLGVPVICSNIEVFKEVSGPCAHYIDPVDMVQLADQLRSSVENLPNNVLRDQMRTRANMFRTDVEGKKLVDLISKCL